MPAKPPIVEFSRFSLDRVIADIEAIRRVNRQRHEMEQLTAVVFEDEPTQAVVGYKDVTDQEFWVRGHMPDFPLMPGVVMCEAAAQLASFYVTKRRLLGNHAVGFGGLEEVRFRGPVFPNSRLVVMAQLVRLRPNALVTSRFQGFVNEQLVVEGIILGVPLPEDVVK